jgi:GNAT superfamily N-acetyltransferase
MIQIRPCTVDELEQSDALPALLDAYAMESSIQELGKVGASMEMYRQMEASGALQILGAFAPGLVGLASILVYGLPHYNGRRVCAMESLYVLPASRKGGAGIKLLRAAEDLAASLGASALMVSSPIGGRLGRVLPLAGYRETSRVFIRGLA